MRKLSKPEVVQQAAKLFNTLIPIFGLSSTRRIITALNKKLSAEYIRRKSL